MDFFSFSFIVFFGTVFLLHHYAPDRIRHLVLLMASYIFFGAFKSPQLLGALAASTALTYAAGLSICNRSAGAPGRKLLFWSGIACNLLILVIFRYQSVVFSGLNALSTAVPPSREFWPTIGVSFFTFTAISYLTDVYLGIGEVERNPGYFALHLAFFPKVLQGPIERAGDLLPQLKTRYVFDYDNVRYGLVTFVWGLCKKAVIASRLGIYVDAVYSDPHSWHGIPLLLSTWLYAFQIYFDFSGYTDMALGIARIFNIRLTQNFNQPYFADSIADFWRRWHISFSRWILYYIFRPLQMQFRNGRKGGTVLALLITFSLSGLWHGAGGGFIIWGLLQGIYLSASVLYRPLQKRIYKFLNTERTRVIAIWQIFVTFNLVCLSWVFFRAQSVQDALYILGNFIGNLSGARDYLLMYGKVSALLCISLLLVALAIDGYKNKVVWRDIFARNIYLRWGSYYALVLTIIFLNKQDAEMQFIYFRF
jgi:alginate O-acetyltransferase complex protein AlgI